MTKKQSQAQADWAALNVQVQALYDAWESVQRRFALGGCTRADLDQAKAALDEIQTRPVSENGP